MNATDPVMELVADVPMGTEQVMVVYVDENGCAQLRAKGIRHELLVPLLRRLADHVHVKYVLVPEGQSSH